MQKSSARSPELCAHHSCSQPHIFGDGNAQNLAPTDGGIILLATVTTRNELVPGNIRDHQAVKTKPVLRLHQDNVSPAQANSGRGLHVNHLAVANRGRHAYAAGLEANTNSGLQALQAEGFELPRLRPIVDGAITAPGISHED